MTRLPWLALAALVACATPAGTNPSAVQHEAAAAARPVDVALLRTDWTPQQIQAACDDAEKLTDAKLAQMAALPPGERTFANTVDVLEQVTTDYGHTVGRVTFMKDIHTDEKVRAAPPARSRRASTACASPRARTCTWR